MSKKHQICERIYILFETFKIRHMVQKKTICISDRKRGGALFTTQSPPALAPWCSAWWQSCSEIPRLSPTPHSSTLFPPPPCSLARTLSTPPEPTQAVPSWAELDGCANSNDPVEVDILVAEVDILAVEADILANWIGPAEQLDVAPGLHHI